MQPENALPYAWMTSTSPGWTVSITAQSAVWRSTYSCASPDARSSRCGMNCRVSAEPTTFWPGTSGRGPSTNERRMPRWCSFEQAVADPISCMASYSSALGRLHSPPRIGSSTARRGASISWSVMMVSLRLALGGRRH